MTDAWSAVWARVPGPVRTRLVPILLFVPTATVLLTATRLTAEPDGHATHLQLGLNPCTVLSATGYPCPVCGATTTFTLWAHGHPIEGLINQPFASLLFVLSVWLFFVTGLEAVWPTGRLGRALGFLDRHELVLLGGFVVVMIGAWIYKAWLMGLL